MANLLLEGKLFDITVKRLAFQLIENHPAFENAVLIGLQPRGIYLAEALKRTMESINPAIKVPLGYLDITFYRDDFRRRKDPIVPNNNRIDFIIEDKNVVLVDDVLFTGRSIRSALDAILDYGRPSKVEFLTLVNRIFSRQLPIEPDYSGITVDTRANQKVKVEWNGSNIDNKVWLVDLKPE